MPAPTQPTYSVAATSAFATAFLALLDAGAGAAFLRIRSAADVLLASITLTDPAGTVSGVTGKLSCTPASASTAITDGTAAYGQLCDSTGLVHLSLPAAAGTVAVDGVVVLNSLVMVAGATVTATSITVG